MGTQHQPPLDDGVNSLEEHKKERGAKMRGSAELASGWMTWRRSTRRKTSRGDEVTPLPDARLSLLSYQCRFS